MKFLIGIFLGFFSLLNPEIKVFFYIKYGLLVLLFYICIIILPFSLKKMTVLSKKSFNILVWILGITFLPTVLFAYLNVNYEIDQYIRIILYFPIILYIINNKMDLRSYIIRLSIIFNIVAIFQMVLLDDLGRVSSLFSHPNFYSIYLVILIIFLLEKNLIAKSLKDRLYIQLYIFLIIGIILFGTGSRTSFIVTMIIILIHYYRVSRKNFKFLITINLIIIAGIFIILFLKDNLMETRIFKLDYGLQYSYQVDSFTWRLMRWKDGLLNWMNESFFIKVIGSGWQSSPLLSSYFRGFSMHNEYLRMLIEFGLLGLLSYMILLIRLLILGTKKHNEEGYVSLFLISILLIISSITENILVSSESYSIIITSIATSLAIINKKELMKGSI